MLELLSEKDNVHIIDSLHYLHFRSYHMPKSSLRPPAGHESADVRVVAPVNAGQQGDTSIDAFQRWLETAAHEAHFAYENPPADLSGQDLRLHLEGCEIALLDCRAATRLLMAFKLERLA